MSLSKVYEPAKYEDDIYALWEKKGAFKADPTSDKERFSIAMPPPNETGTLSLGHAMFTIEDIMVRHARQQGKDALWLPGTDHAALAVNAIIEKKLTDEGTNKHQIGREDFLKRTREFVGDSRDTMIKQMRAMGFSADWSRLRYTLDDSLNRMVNETFQKMYQKELIYRGHRIVNWDPKLETNVSDDELEHVEEEGVFYTFQYGPFQIGTARPETKFGDKYVVMHPDDKRYAQYKHRDTFEAEWINGPISATVIKDKAIDMAFGTGVMTITPWHDHTDFDIAERHQLDKEQIIDFTGKLLPIAGEFTGMHIETARPKIVEKLRAKGLVVKEEQGYLHNVAINSRGKGKIEPQIRLQWFVDVNKPAVRWKGAEKSLKQVMRDVVESGDINITPKRFEKVYYHWIDNLRDWCISRQIWWGHRIPVWYRMVDSQEQTYVGTRPPKDDKSGEPWQQDPDTLDTWFSSALWTWSTLIDQEKAADYSLSLEELFKLSPDFQAYHPTSVMETGWDILFFWVARMTLATTFMTGQVPFKDVYLHGMVRAEDGKKMSKSRPESIVDPLTLIPKYGTDAIRISLVWGTSPGSDFNWSTPKLESTRNFCNKLWNVARYIEATIGDSKIDLADLKIDTPTDHWMMSKLQHTTKSVASHLDKFRFSEAFDELYHFVWDDVADWYIEASKTQPNLNMLAYVLDSTLRLLHPYAPFMTEAIWQNLSWTNQTMLITAPWPNIAKMPAVDAKKALQFDAIKQLVTEVRFICNTLELHKPNLIYESSTLLEENSQLVAKLAGLGAIEQGTGQGIKLSQTKEQAWLDVDTKTAANFVAQLKSRAEEQGKVVKNLEGRLANKTYVANAPKHIVDQTKAQLAEAQGLLDKLVESYKRFK